MAQINRGPYDVREYAEMILMYGQCNNNAAAAARLYHETFPNRRAPTGAVITSAVNRLFENGNVVPLLHRGHGHGVAGRPMDVRNVENEETIITFFADNPRKSIRNAVRILGCSYGTIRRTLKTENLHAYHFRKVHQLNEDDKEMRLNFCHWVLGQIAGNPDFVNNIIFSDESGFDRDGTFNVHNEHYWSEENTCMTIVAKHQNKFSINVWAAILGNHCYGPIDVPRRLNAENYRELLEAQLPNITNNAPNPQRIWFQHDGAPAHSARLVRHFLDRRFPERWIGIGGTQRWPPRSPDLNPIDFFLWGFIDGKVYTSEIENQADLNNRVQQAFLLITEEMLVNTKRNFQRRLGLCIECEGGHFEHLL